MIRGIPERRHELHAFATRLCGQLTSQHYVFLEKCRLRTWIGHITVAEDKLKIAMLLLRYSFAGIRQLDSWTPLHGSCSGYGVVSQWPESLTLLGTFCFPTYYLPPSSPPRLHLARGPVTIKEYYTFKANVRSVWKTVLTFMCVCCWPLTLHWHGTFSFCAV